jgi:outer membrane beta-barrel protein
MKKPAALWIILAGLASSWSVPSWAQDEGGGMDFGIDEAAAPADAPPADTPPAEGAEGGGTPTEAAAGAEEKSSLDEGINLTLQDRIKAVSRKVFLKEGRFELDPGVAVTTNDPFFRSWSIAGRGAYHINDAFAVELGGAYVPPFFIETLAPVDLLRQQARLVNVDSKLTGFVDAGVTFSPVYGKLAILSDAIIHFDAFAAAGGGAVFDQSVALVHPTMDIGGGLRVFMLRWLVVRADLRDYVYPQDKNNISTLQNLLMFSLNVGFFFPFDFEYRYEAARVKS